MNFQEWWQKNKNNTYWQRPEESACYAYNAGKSEMFSFHETFLVRLCEIMKVPYEDTSEEDILEVVKHLMESK